MHVSKVENCIRTQTGGSDQENLSIFQTQTEKSVNLLGWSKYDKISRSLCFSKIVGPKQLKCFACFLGNGIPGTFL